MKPGERVFAIRNVVDGAKVYAYGAGVYMGHERPPNGTTSLAGPIGDDLPGDFVNPRIDLDNGSTVWGCQCTFGPEEEVRAKYADREIVEVPVPQLDFSTQ